MVKSNKHIQIVRTSISRLSSMSQESCDAIYEVLIRHYTKVGVSVVNNLSDLETLVSLRPEVVFLGAKFVTSNQGSDSERIWLAEYLEEHDIAYTGSDQMAHNLELNKPLAKQRVLDVGLMTPPFWVVHQNRQQAVQDIPLEFPLFVKPTDRGGGQGINACSVVLDFLQLRSKIESVASELQSDCLVEEYLPGREFSVAILEDSQSGDMSAMPIELIAPPDSRGARLLSRTVKSSNCELALKVTDELIKSRVVALALDVFYSLGARDYGRIDIRLDKNGQPHFLEANLVPSLIEGYGSFPKACALNEGLDYESMILNIVHLAHNRASVIKAAISDPGEVTETLPVFGWA